MNTYILRDTNRSDLATSNYSGHGGNKRTAQIAELVSAAGLKIYDIPKKIQTNLNRWNRYSQGLFFLNQYRFTIKPDIKKISVCGYSYHIYKEFFQNHKSAKIFLLEEPNNFIAYYVAQKENFKIVAIPHNLETLVVGYQDYFTGKPLPDCLENEIKHLSKADVIFCISREEQWLLRLRGLKADFLPYYPPQISISNFLEIRQERTNVQNQRSRFLILGTAHNPATFMGMIEQAEWLKKVYHMLNFEVDIAGYETEKLEPYFRDNPAFKLHGTVDNKKLKELMINTKGILIHQSTGVGALTRIPDMLVAGIPVIASSHACRSAFGYSGVFCYENEYELAQLISQEFQTPDILPRPVAAEKRFIKCLQELIEQSKV